MKPRGGAKGSGGKKPLLELPPNSVEVLDPDALSGPDLLPLSAAAAAAASSSPASVWRRGPDTVLPRSAHACAVLGGRVYALGGTGGGGAGGGLHIGGGGGGGGGGTHRRCEALNLGAGCWRLLASDTAVERKYLAAAAHGSRRYVSGGVSYCPSRLFSLETLDPWEGRWMSLQAAPAPRFSHAMAALRASLYEAGGQCSGSTDAPSTVACGDAGAAAGGSRGGVSGWGAG